MYDNSSGARDIGRHRGFAAPWVRRLTVFLGTLLVAGSFAGAVPAHAAASIESMPLWRFQVRLTTGSDGTDAHPAIRFNSSSTGVRTLNPRSEAAFDAGHVDTYDLRLLDSPSQISMLRIGIAGDNWCVKKVELLFNGRVAFSRDAVPGGSGCAMVGPGTYLEFSSADLRSNAKWVGYGTPPALPTSLSAVNLRALVESVTGSAMLSSPGYEWDRSTPLTISRVTSATFRVSFGVRIVPAAIEVPFTTRISYDVRLFVGSDGRLHAAKTNASCCYHGTMSDAVVAQLNTALSKMTAHSPSPNALTFGVDAFTNITWRWVPLIG